MQLIRVGIWPSLGRPEWVLAPGPCFHIGRNPDCEVVLSDPAVSAYHAQVCDNGWQVRDLASTNGVWLDGQRVGEGIYSPEKSLRIGGYTLRWNLVKPSQAAPDELEALAGYLEKHGDPRLYSLATDWAAARPGDPRAQRTLARWFLKTGDLDGADQAIKKAALVDGEDWRTLLLAARLAEEKGQLAVAQGLLEQVESLAPNREEILAHARRVGQKLEVYAKVSQLVSAQGGHSPASRQKEALLTAGPFHIRFVPTAHGDLVLTAHSALAAAAERLEDMLGFTPHEIQVRLVARDAGSWRAAAYEGAIEVYVPQDSKPDPNFFLVALTHEYVHLAVDRLADGAEPAWLSEGLAQYITQNQTPSDRRLLEKAVSKDAVLPLEILEFPFEGLEEKPLVDLAYAQAYSIIEFLVSGWGLAGVRNILQELHKSKTWQAGLKPLGVLPESFEDNWLAWLTQSMEQGQAGLQAC